jgi:hypothetical protein
MIDPDEQDREIGISTQHQQVDRATLHAHCRIDDPIDEIGE